SCLPARVWQAARWQVARRQANGFRLCIQPSLPLAVIPSPHTRARSAAAWMLLAGLLFAIMDAAIKWIADSYSPFQVAVLRSVAAMPPVLLWIVLRGKLGTLLRIHWPLHLVRGVIGVGVMGCFIYGVARMPLSTAY